MINSTQDILYLALTVAIAWLVIFFVWICIYIIMITRDLREISKIFKERVNAMANSLSRFKDTTEKVTLLSSFVSKVFIQFFEYIKSKKTKRGKGKKSQE